MAQPEFQATTMTGGCLCKAIRYTLTGTPKASGLCYCPDCRKASGSVFVPWMLFDATNIKIEDNLKAVRQHKGVSAMGTEKVINFCSGCGSLIFGGKYGENVEHTVYAGTLDDEFVGYFEPKMAIFTRARPEWGAVKCEMGEFGTMPGGGE